MVTRFVLEDKHQIHSTDINECLSNNGGCSYQCENSIGSFSCKCQDGFTLAQDQRSCVGKNVTFLCPKNGLLRSINCTKIHACNLKSLINIRHCNCVNLGENKQKRLLHPTIWTREKLNPLHWHGYIITRDKISNFIIKFNAYRSLENCRRKPAIN